MASSTSWLRSVALLAWSAFCLPACQGVVESGSGTGETAGITGTTDSTTTPPSMNMFSESQIGTDKIFSLSTDGRLYSNKLTDAPCVPSATQACVGNVAISTGCVATKDVPCVGGIALGVFRPEQVGVAGHPFVDPSALSGLAALYTVKTEEGQCKGHVSGAPLAIVPVPLSGQDNPYKSDDAGKPMAQPPTSGPMYETYDVAIFSSRGRPVLNMCADYTHDADCLQHYNGVAQCSPLSENDIQACASSETVPPVSPGAECDSKTIFSDTLVRGEWRITVANPRTPSAVIVHTEPVNPDLNFEYVKTTDHRYIHGIEPTVTADNNLIVYNDSGQLRYLVWQPATDTSPDMAGTDRDPWASWIFRRDSSNAPANGLSAMSTNEANTEINGVKFSDRYPLARQPLLDPAGTPFPTDQEYPGAYAWLSPDASELFHTTMRGHDAVDGGVEARRFGQVVIGQLTNYQQRLIDSRANPNLYDSVRQVIAPLGSYPSMWTPFVDTPEVKFPQSPRRPMYAYFENRTETYSELPFDDVKDGEYLVYLHMNEMIAQNKLWDGALCNHTSGGACSQATTPFLGLTDDTHINANDLRTPDTSGYYDPTSGTWRINATAGHLKGGATFPPDVGLAKDADGDGVRDGGPDNGGTDGINTDVGITGQAIVFPAGGFVQVDKAAGLSDSSPTFSRIHGQMSAELWMRCLPGADCTNVSLVSLASSFQMGIDESGALAARVFLGTSSSSETEIYCANSTATPSLVDGAFHAVGFSYHVETKPNVPIVKLYIDGQMTNSCALSSLPPSTQVFPGNSHLVIGPASKWHTDKGGDSGSQQMILDEFALSDVARQDDEFLVAALRNPTAGATTPSDMSVPLGLHDDELLIPTGNQYDVTKASLGRQLFFDKRLSKNGTTACASCHNPDHAFSDAAAISQGDGPDLGVRNAPSVLNRAFSTRQMRDGKASSLETQALLPLQSPTEMNLTDTTAVQAMIKRVLCSTSPSYNALIPNFSCTSPPASTDDVNASLTLVADALAVYERTLFSGNSYIDQYESSGAPPASDEQQAAIRGRLLFRGKARCIACHNGPNYTDELYHDTGFVVPKSTDTGRERVTGRTEDVSSFRTPSLRDVAFSYPYLHDGSFASGTSSAYSRMQACSYKTTHPSVDALLLTMIDNYDTAPTSGSPAAPLDPLRDPQLFPLGLKDNEKCDLVAFLRNLSSINSTGSGASPSITNGTRPDTAYMPAYPLTP